MDIIIALILVAIITISVKAVSRFLPFSVCAICMGVSGAWVLLSLAILTGVVPSNLYLDVITLLMGGTVVGIAYQAEKKFGWRGEKAFWSKFAVIVAGFYAAHVAVGGLSWTVFAIELFVLVILAYLFFIRQDGANLKSHSAKVEKLEKELENCC
ncbi:MAG: hypothetical protein A2931_01560 [Candidatus Niyogibacteria bacterium RIFCSPLOWO2_01_FULL_45_48]|uniref:Uncharacterized protein n=2 Tax=Candidatus Niyogiibacteriota TaxID=1817912 RepID=A0A1G2EZD3_9BACT|nr:MAG: hypothetical protein A2931_01560 [Candidatus Niyogibacteria bacterium RIFCSPLOWO2_01_FULL_45_48]OGZ31057.1 MAG: hypothetical protein A3J00_03125 [Candidatus Niyogibacteria bacterium RIFCSPLOWO2_02_FULL_45_13]